jgi:hypothetical protein
MSEERLITVVEAENTRLKIENELLKERISFLWKTAREYAGDDSMRPYFSDYAIGYLNSVKKLCNIENGNLK